MQQFRINVLCDENIMQVSASQPPPPTLEERGEKRLRSSSQPTDVHAAVGKAKRGRVPMSRTVRNKD